MYKGYRRVLSHEHSGDPAKQFDNVPSYFFRGNLIMFFPGLKIDLQGSKHYQREKLLPLQQTSWSLNGIVLTVFSNAALFSSSTV